MSLLLDTHTLLWWLYGEPHLSERAHSLIASCHPRVLVSAASAWEIATKHRLGRPPGVEPLLADFDRWLREAGFAELPIGTADALLAGRLPHPHRDPFDRMIAAQSLRHGLTVVTRDEMLAALGASVAW